MWADKQHANTVNGTVVTTFVPPRFCPAFDAPHSFDEVAGASPMKTEVVCLGMNRGSENGNWGEDGGRVLESTKSSTKDCEVKRKKLLLPGGT